MVRNILIVNIIRWFMPVNILVTFLLGSALGWIIIKLTKHPKHTEGLIVGVCSAGRSFHYSFPQILSILDTE